ncbi:MAG: hypothetical protein IPJ65_37530 [Archangiaceae bacterium]|nr:hypothetical protein [Archangiaceae bacterium]
MSGLLLLLAVVAAEPPPAPTQASSFDEKVLSDADQREAEMLGYLDGVGFLGRENEATVEVAYGSKQIATTRLELAHAFPISGKLLHVVARVGAGMATDFHALGLHGFTAALGLRHITGKGHFFVEVGARFLGGWQGIHGDRPEAQTLALGATLTSGAADDARWLPLRSSGLQLYVDFLSRSKPMGYDHSGFFVAGFHYGGQATVVPPAVSTWLGSEPQFVGNVFIEAFLSFATRQGTPVRLTTGAHVDLSLSSIWPSNVPFPVVLDLFFEWHPAWVSWLSLRAFGGLAVSLGAFGDKIGQGGLRLVATF